MLVDNRFMLERFRAADEVFYFNACHDIVMAGENYKISAIRHYISDRECPLENYVRIKYYKDNFLLVYAHTRDEALLGEALADVAQSEAEEKEFCTPYPELLTSQALTSRFTTSETETPDPVYYVHAREELPPLVLPPEVTVSVATDADRAEVEADAARRGLSPDNYDEIGPWIFHTSSCFKDTRLYLIRVNGVITGSLRAECGYENFYDVGWLHVVPSCRGRGYAAYLTLSFSHDCFVRGDIPHYGYAISPESVRVAEKCGYRCDKTPLTHVRLHGFAQ